MGYRQRNPRRGLLRCEADFLEVAECPWQPRRFGHRHESRNLRERQRRFLVALNFRRDGGPCFWEIADSQYVVPALLASEPDVGHFYGVLSRRGKSVGKPAIEKEADAVVTPGDELPFVITNSDYGIKVLAEAVADDFERHPLIGGDVQGITIDRRFANRGDDTCRQSQCLNRIRLDWTTDQCR